MLLERVVSMFRSGGRGVTGGWCQGCGLDNSWYTIGPSNLSRMNKGMTYDNLFLKKEYKEGVCSSSLVLPIYLFLGGGKQGGKGGYNCFNRQTRWLPCSGLPCSGLPCSGLPCSGLPC